MENLIKGDLCLQEGLNANSLTVCRATMDRVLSQGLIGINSYVFSSEKAVKDIFDAPAREKSDMIYALNYSQFIKVELNDNAYFVSGYERSIATQIIETNRKVADKKNLMIAVIILFFIADAIIGLILWRKISLNVRNERIIGLRC